MKRISAFVNGELGLQILDDLLSRRDCEVEQVIINHETKRISGFEKEITRRALAHGKTVLPIGYSRQLWEDKHFRQAYEVSTHVISVLFGHLIPSEFLNKPTGRAINLHPSYLPTGRGADPIAWAILDGSKQGVSIHEISPKVDSGPLFYQKEIETTLSQDAGQVYQCALEELRKGFKYIVEAWLEGNLEPELQKAGGSYHHSRELSKIRQSLLTDGRELEKAIRTINALNFSDNRCASFRDSTGKLWRAEVRLNAMEEKE